MMRDIDIVIPVHNGPIEIISTCLESVMAAQPLNGYNIEIIDDASTSADVVDYLGQIAGRGGVTITRNAHNLGFTRSVNRGMALHPEHDVVLLNSDTVVYGDWARRLQAAAASRKRVATVNPMSNGWMSNYPNWSTNNLEHDLEICDQSLDEFCARVNRNRHVEVYGTIGFCMFIAREALLDVGLFDHENFPRGYGEETDFCYRTRYVGWSHLISGSVFVRHWENTSFSSDEKRRLIQESASRFEHLHPIHPSDRERFTRRDPVKPLREALDLARLRHILAGEACLVCCSAPLAARSTPYLRFDPGSVFAQFVTPHHHTFFNLPELRFSADLASVNKILNDVGIRELCFLEPSLHDSFARIVRSAPFELALDIPFRLATEVEARQMAPQLSRGTATQHG